MLQTLQAHDHVSDEAEDSIMFNGWDALRFFRVVAQDEYSITNTAKLTKMKTIGTYFCMVFLAVLYQTTRLALITEGNNS